MTPRTTQGGLRVATSLNDLLAQRLCPGTGLAPEAVLAALEGIVADLAPRVRALLARRDDMQAQIDAWHRRHAGAPPSAPTYETFLREIGYLLPEGPDFSVATANVDAEVARIAGPQLVVPVTNARYALNAANARWGSLYDALYGTDVIPEADGCGKAGGYNPARGAKVIAFARRFLDQAAPLAAGSHKDARGYAVDGGSPTATPSSFCTPVVARRKHGRRGERKATGVLRAATMQLAFKTPMKTKALKGGAACPAAADGSVERQPLEDKRLHPSRSSSASSTRLATPAGSASSIFRDPTPPPPSAG